MRKMKNTISNVTGNCKETFNDSKTIEDKTESGTITTNATNETRYVKPIYHTGYVFIVEEMLVVASSMAKAIELYCYYTEKDEDEVKEVRRLSNGRTSVLDMSYDAIIEG